MRENWQKAFLHTLEHEGGYVNHPHDPGGHTNLGITFATLKRFDPSATLADLKALKPGDDIVQKIYHDGYWAKIKGNELPGGVDAVTYDAAVNSGPSRAARWLQRAALVEPDGVIGPITIDAVWKLPPSTVVKRCCDDRLAWLKRLKTWQHFGRGWGRRVAGLKAFGLELAAKGGAHENEPQPIDTIIADPKTKYVGGGILALLVLIVEWAFG